MHPHVTTDLFWDTVVSIEDLGEQFCYDLEVADTHNFVAGGLVTHNSTTLGNKIIANSILRPMMRSLYIAPRGVQIEEFSKTRIDEPLRMSPVLRQYILGKEAVNNVLEKRFAITNSRIAFRSVFFDADSTRGLTIDSLTADEIQDIRSDLLPVVEESMSHSPLKFKAYSGTPKSFDNTIEDKWGESTQFEWVIPCDRCGGGDYRFWNVITYESVQPSGLSCTRCGKLINPRHVSAQWAAMRSPEWLRNPPPEYFEGYRIAQPMVSWLNWSEVYSKKLTYSIPVFHNEVLGLSYDSGEKLINPEALRTCSHPTMVPEDLKNYVGRTALYMGIDWGGGGVGSKSYTAIAIGGYTGDTFAIPYMRRLEGMDAEPDNVKRIINELISKYRIHLVGTDYGGGHQYNDYLIRQYGKQKIMSYQYVNTKLIYFDSTLMRWMANRTEVIMAALVNSINRTGVFTFPKWESWGEYCGGDFTSLLAERSERTGTTQIIKTPGSTDDIAHAVLYCFLASMVDRPRPDILQPDKEKRE
jgi:hypothetical protein